MVLGKDDGKVVIFSITKNEPKRVYEATACKEHAITGLCFANLSLSFLTGSKDGRIYVWSLMNQTWQKTPIELYAITINYPKTTFLKLPNFFLVQ